MPSPINSGPVLYAMSLFVMENNNCFGKKKKMSKLENVLDGWLDSTTDM